MKIKSLLFIISSILLFTESQAKTKTRKISQIEGVEVRVEIGEKSTVFRIKNEPKPLAEYFNSLGDHKFKEITKKDYLFLVSKIDSLPKKQSVELDCPRENIEIYYANLIYKSCLSGKSKFAHEMKDIINTLSLLF